MKENKYDNKKFFDAYRQFPRSIQGLAAAGEWHEFQKMMPDFHGKDVLDIGCGFGWHCFYAAQQGASSVLGTDISANMISVAQEKNTYKQVTFRQEAMEDLSFQDARFHIVLSSLAFHYTADFDNMCARIYKWLRPNGVFVFSVEHPIFTASGSQEWIYTSTGEKEHWPVDNYFIEGKRTALFLGESVTKYHRTMTSYIDVLLTSGFTITKVVEPLPPSELFESVPEMKDEIRRPMMLLIAAQK